MSTLNISLPEDVKKWVKRQALEKGYDTADKFLLDILRREQALEAREQIDQILIEAMSTGKPTPMTKADWNRIRTHGSRRAQERKR